MYYNNSYPTHKGLLKNFNGFLMSNTVYGKINQYLPY